MENTRREILSYLDTISLVVVAVVFVLFPLLFTTITSDAFILPKQLLLGAGVVIGLLLIGVRAIVEKKITLRSTPFDLPVFLFTLVAFVSALLAVNRFDALTAFVPLLFATLLYYVIVSAARTKQAIVVLVAALLLGASISGLLSVLSFFKLYVLPFTYTQAQSFNTYGSLLDQAIYLALVLPLAGYFIHPVFTKMFMNEKNQAGTDALFGGKKMEMNGTVIAFGVSFAVITISILITLFMLLTTQKPLILPFETGFQTAFATISQDAGRVMKSFFFGSGYGTFLTDFTRFHSAAYNANQTLWSFTFFRSSSFLLELLSTVGLLGVLAFFFIIYRLVKEGWLFLPLALAVIAAILLPFSFTIQALFFILLGLFAAIRAYQNPKKYSNVELHLMTLKQGIQVTRNEGDAEPKINLKNTAALPIVFFVIMAIALGALSYFTVRYFLSDVAFQKSLVAANANDGQGTYQGQINAINLFPYRDTYYRVFSQVNLQLANTRALSLPKNASPSAQDQQAILTLIQQAITAGRTSVTVSPQTSLNWNNLSDIYRSLIGFGQNADQFAVLTNQQALALDPNNPQQYLNLGGIYYQLGQWDLASNAFQQAIQLKPDYANAYYNLGHALESKGDLNNALQAYLVVKNLVASDKANEKTISDEIAALQAKIGSAQANAQNNQQQASQTPEQQQQPLDVNKPTAQLPERNPQVKIPGPTISPEPSTKPSASPSPAEKTSPTPTK